MNIGTQYYRAPFPESEYWERDFKKIRESGFNTVQLWVSWGWVEANPDKFIWDEYDQLVELAAKNKLGVVLSTLAEIHPNWIHRVIPGSEMIDNLGHKVVSCARREHHFGLTPGGCSDHPEVWQRMANFIRETGRRYASLDNLRGWDIWNELRWNVHADGLACFCKHTLAAFRKWLEQRHGSLEALNHAWKRRYASWDDVMPGKLPDRVYTEMMAFQHFITARADAHAAARYDVMREIDKIHPITAHGSRPTPLYPGVVKEYEYALDRGNDWNIADKLDGVGCSSFPVWERVDDADFALRIDMVKSAARGKKVWLSEIQGGRSVVGFDMQDTLPVTASRQQRWIWNGLACGADTILFWCWRDEIFGRESGGFGISGADGFADERLAATKLTGALLEKHAALFDTYTPHKAQAGIFFSPQSYYLAWSQDGNATRIRDGLTSYGRALSRRSIPLICIEETHLGILDDPELKVLFMPRIIVTDTATENALLRFVERGGTLVVESECGAFNSAGFYRYPEKRFLARAGIEEAGRRLLATNPDPVFHYNGKDHRPGVAQWLTPLKTQTSATETNLCTVKQHGAGRIIHLASYPGNAWREKWNPDFENLIMAIISDAGITPPAIAETPAADEKNFVYLKSGKTKNGTLLFVFFPENAKNARIALSPEIFPGNKVREIFSGAQVAVDTGGGRRQLAATAADFNLAIYTDA